MNITQKVQITLNGKEIELTGEEALELRDHLNDMFPITALPSPINPYIPAYPNTPPWTPNPGDSGDKSPFYHQIWCYKHAEG